MNIKKILKSREVLYAIFFLCIFTLSFLTIVSNFKDAIVDRNFHNYDEINNGTVTSNLTRQIFPPMIRINPLAEKQGSWQEGPYWQHIPPLYMYAPLPFISLLNDGVPNPAVIRIAYITILFLSFVLFILSIFYIERSLLSIFTATVSAIILISTEFTQQLMLGYLFNNSDIVLFASIMLSFLSINLYLKETKEKRLNYSTKKIILLSLLVTLPIVVKTVLGAIPLAIFLILILNDHRTFKNRKFIYAIITSFILLVSAYLPLYISSPDTFINEILTPLNHVTGYNERPAKPWYSYLTNIIPDKYLGSLTIPFYAGFILCSFFIYRINIPRKTKNLLIISNIWFIWNLIAISATTIKIPNFIFQSFILSVFFVIYSILCIVKIYFDYSKEQNTSLIHKINDLFNSFINSSAFRTAVIGVFVITILFFTTTSRNILASINDPIVIDSMSSRYRQFAESLRDKGISSKDLVLLYATDVDCNHLKLGIIFNTGAESESFSKLKYIPNLSNEYLKSKYKNVYLVIKNEKNKKELNIPHSSEEMGIFELLKIDNKNISETFVSDINSYINKLDYTIEPCSLIQI